MIDIARPVGSAGTVDCPAGVDLEQVSVIDPVCDFRGKLPAAIADDELPSSDRHGGKKAESGSRSTDPEVA